MEAQEYALNTRSTEAGVYYSLRDPSCRLSKGALGTAQHIAVECKLQAGIAYTENHNKVAGIVYRNICAVYGLEIPQSRWNIRYGWEHQT